MTSQGQSRPLPEPDERSLPFFEAARRRELGIQRCANCRTFQPPGRVACDECLCGELDWTPASGRGKIFSYVVVHQEYHPAFSQSLPYNVAVVELEEGPRLTTKITGVANEELEAGADVEVDFEDVNGGITLPHFRPAGKSPQDV